jgi:hypothetical protein
VRCDSDAVTLFTTCFYGVCLEPDTFFSYVHKACLSRTFPCLLLVHGLSMQGCAIDARLPAQKQCSRRGGNEHGSHLDSGREKVASRNTRAFAEVAIPLMSGIVKRSRSGENHTSILLSKLSKQFDSCSATRQVQKDIPHPFLRVTHRQDTEMYVVVLPIQQTSPQRAALRQF